MCVFCMFYVDLELEGQEKLEGSYSFEHKLFRVGLQETNNCFF